MDRRRHPFIFRVRAAEQPWTRFGSTNLEPLGTYLRAEKMTQRAAILFLLLALVFALSLVSAQRAPLCGVKTVTKCDLGRTGVHTKCVKGRFTEFVKCEEGQ